MSEPDHDHTNIVNGIGYVAYLVIRKNTKCIRYHMHTTYIFK